MSIKVDQDAEKLLRDYLSHNQIVIVDAVPSGRMSLATALVSLGAIRQKMSLVGTLQEAREELRISNAKIIFSDFMVGSESALDLIQFQKTAMDQEKIKDTLFVLVTANASQSTVARAAEEDVDTFIVKPYSLDVLRKSLSQTLQLKLFPNRYMQLINEGKEHLTALQYDLAIDCFSRAMDEHEKPTLACFYYGQAEYMKKAFDLAEKKYIDGLSYNKIHYKCLVALFDLLYEERKFQDSYAVIKKIAQYFPANPKRLSTVLRLAVMTDNYQDTEGYYRIFVKIDERTDDLIRYMCSALVVTGKYYLRQKINTRAIDVFESAAVSAGGRVNFLLYIVEALTLHGLYEESNHFVSRLRSVAPASKEMQAAEFLSLNLSVDLKKSIEQGESILKKGVEFPCVYEKLILQSIQNGDRDAALKLAKKACEKWPEKKNAFTHGFDPKEIRGAEIAS